MKRYIPRDDRYRPYDKRDGYNDRRFRNGYDDNRPSDREYDNRSNFPVSSGYQSSNSQRDEDSKNFFADENLKHEHDYNSYNKFPKNRPYDKDVLMMEKNSRSVYVCCPSCGRAFWFNANIDKRDIEPSCINCKNDLVVNGQNLLQLAFELQVKLLRTGRLRVIK